MSDRQCDRLAAETNEEREARLQQVSDRQCDRLAAETNEEREARLQRVKDSLLCSGSPPRCSTSV